MKGVKTFKDDYYNLFNYYDGELVHHFTRQYAKTLAGENVNERQFIIERRETVKAATLGALNGLRPIYSRSILRRFAANRTLPRPPDPQAKCYLSGADDIRPALFRALNC
jgi:hypothetical protein